MKKAYLLATLVIAAAVSVTALGADAAATAPLQIQVIYSKRACASAPARPAQVTAGTLELTRAGSSRRVRVSLLDTRARATLGGSGPVSATLVLNTPRVRVVNGASSTTAVRIPLRKATPDGRGRVAFSVGRDEDDNARVNTLISLQRAARIAAVTSPRQLRLMFARMDTGSGPAFDAPNSIHIGDAAWEPTPLVHEYGHFLLNEIAPDGSPGGDHHIAQSYPARPNLAWGEGFPSAFAAVVLREGQGAIFVDCGKPYQNFAASPAQPPLAGQEHRRRAQYNETRVGGVTYQLIQHLGRGNTGMKRLLMALTRYRRAGHSVWTARDLRDLAVQNFERTAADHVAIDRIFLRQEISWSQRITVEASDLTKTTLERDMQSADAELVVSVTGPGGFDCRGGADDIDSLEISNLDFGIANGVKRAEGGLAYSADDDCYLVSGNGKVGDPEEHHELTTDGITIPFPYLRGGAHWNGVFTVRVRYVCALDERLGPPENFKCPAVLPVSIGVANPVSTALGVPRLFPIQLRQHADQVVATFSADGKCTVMGTAPPASGDCST